MTQRHSPGVERELENRLTKSFEHRMVSDVPVGVFLSAGIDSATILALASESQRGELRSFTLDISDQTRKPER